MGWSPRALGVCGVVLTASDGIDLEELAPAALGHVERKQAAFIENAARELS